jgi:hypothetical protein
MDLPLWARKCSEINVLCSCNHFAVTSDKGPCVFDGHSVCLCVCVCVCV